LDETYRMLGREHKADLEREAQKRRLAAVAGRRPVLPDKRPLRTRSRFLFFRVKGA